MRLRERDLTTVYLKKRQIEKDDEGNDVVTYSPEFQQLRMNVQSAGGQVAAMVYGQRLPYMKSCKYQGDLLQPDKNESDGICLYVKPEEQPDYFIKSIHSFSTHYNVILEKRDIDED